MTTRRRLSWQGFAAIVVANLVIIQGGGQLAHRLWDSGDGFVTSRDLVVNMWVPLGAALVFTYAVIAWLGWWDPVLREERRVRSWVWAVPIILGVCIAVAVD